jgi:hypothetical protein
VGGAASRKRAHARLSVAGAEKALDQNRILADPHSSRLIRSARIPSYPENDDDTNAYQSTRCKRSLLVLGRLNPHS